MFEIPVLAGFGCYRSALSTELSLSGWHWPFTARILAWLFAVLLFCRLSLRGSVDSYHFCQQITFLQKPMARDSVVAFGFLKEMFGCLKNPEAS